MIDFSPLIILAGALALGMAHAFEVDHMTAVSTFVAQRPSPKQAALFGIKWSVGYGTSLLVFGSILYGLKLTLSEQVAHGLERLVGLALLALGCWTLSRLKYSFASHTHGHSHTAGQPQAGVDGEGKIAIHTHADGTKHAHSHTHGSLLMGVLHGAAGTAAFVGETIVAVSQTYMNVVAFTLAFSIGVLVAMGAYAGVLGGLISWGERRGTLILHGVRGLTGVWACCVGLYWILR